MAYVYLHRKKLNNQIFYVGIGSDSKGKYTRANILNGRGRNKHWQNVVNRYGYLVEITHDNIIWEEACSIEKYLISLYGRKDLGVGKLVNKTDGGEGFLGVIITDETRKKISDKNKGSNHPMFGKHLKQSTKDKIRIANTGNLFSVDRKNKISTSTKGRVAHNKSKKMSESVYKNHLLISRKRQKEVCKYSLDGEFICKYASVINSAKENKLGQGNITNACHKKIMYGGYLWRYVTNGYGKNIEPYISRIQKILKLSMSGEFIEEYENAMDAAKKNNYQKSSILRVCNKKYKQAYGYKWKYKL